MPIRTISINFGWLAAGVLAACGSTVTVIGGGAGGAGASSGPGAGAGTPASATHATGTSTTTVTTGPHACTPGQVAPCSCPGTGAPGAQICNMDGSGYGPCACDQPTGSQDQCVMCVNGPLQIPPCTDSLSACQKDPQCAGWLKCTGDCFQNDWTVGCWRACDKKFASAKALWTAMYQCVCTPCAGPCAVAC